MFTTYKRNTEENRQKNDKINEKMDNHDERITQLEKMADNREQDRRTNLII